MAGANGFVDPNRKCPKCGSADYQFRSRKKVEGEDGTGQVVVSTYRCKGCGNDWRENLPAKNG